MQFDRPLSEGELQSFKALLKRRSEREPLAYILGKKEFYSMEFEVSRDVLIPRPETELLVEKAVQHFQDRSSLPLRFLDIGTGSGCIALSLAKQFPQAQITALDISEKALQIAQKNAQRHGLEAQIDFIEMDFLNPASRESLKEPFDLIISNPPYVAEKDFPRLAPELRFEPKNALTSGEDGLDFYRELIPATPSHLRQAGLALFEIGFDQAESIEKLATKAGFQKINILKDYAGHPRVASLQLSKD